MTVLADLLRWVLQPFDSWTAHQLEVLRSVSVAFGSALIPALGFLLGWGIKLLRATRRDAKAAHRNTVTENWETGSLIEIPVAETAQHAAHLAQKAADVARVTGEATRQEVSDLAGWVRGPGRRRQATSEIPRLPPEEDPHG